MRVGARRKERGDTGDMVRDVGSAQHRTVLTIRKIDTSAVLN